MPASVAQPTRWRLGNNQNPCLSSWCAASIHIPPLLLCSWSLMCLFILRLSALLTVRLQSGRPGFLGNRCMTWRIHVAKGLLTIPVYSWKKLGLSPRLYVVKLMRLQLHRFLNNVDSSTHWSTVSWRHLLKAGPNCDLKSPRHMKRAPDSCHLSMAAHKTSGI